MAYRPGLASADALRPLLVLAWLAHVAGSVAWKLPFSVQTRPEAVVLPVSCHQAMRTALSSGGSRWPWEATGGPCQQVNSPSSLILHLRCGLETHRGEALPVSPQTESQAGCPRGLCQTPRGCRGLDAEPGPPPPPRTPRTLSAHPEEAVPEPPQPPTVPSLHLTPHSSPGPDGPFPPGQTPDGHKGRGSMPQGSPSAGPGVPPTDRWCCRDQGPGCCSPCPQGCSPTSHRFLGELATSHTLSETLGLGGSTAVHGSRAG